MKETEETEEISHEITHEISHEELAEGLTPDPDDLLPTVVFVHGKEGSPQGVKARMLRDQFSCEAPNFTGMDLEERLELLEECTRDRTDLLLVGSSMGGLVAAITYSRYPERFKGYVLIAPAFHTEDVQQVVNVPEHAMVFHGHRDVIVPIEEVEAQCQRLGIPFQAEKKGDHRMHAAMPEVIMTVRRFLEVV
jgi:predicted esterase